MPDFMSAEVCLSKISQQPANASFGIECACITVGMRGLFAMQSKTQR
jgi:hypothetical protein